jgi:hypothetical protein
VAKFVKTDDPNKVDASPTKAFFVNIITKDVEFDEAIEDLVDNSIDGAKRLRPDGNFDGLRIDIACSREKFSIEDNCGGIPLEIARNYAFKFGRAEGFKETRHSVGQFGIGMKRALFKIGNLFTVSTTSSDASYAIEVDVDAWVGDPENWDFDIVGLKEGEFPEEAMGTRIEVTDLEDGALNRFDQLYFRETLRNSIRVSQQYPIDQGIVISFNGEAIIPPKWRLLFGEGIKPAHIESEHDLGGAAALKIRIFAGVADSSREKAGWYVFCNGRNILKADQSRTTGWSESNDAGSSIPKYHGQFSRFRGYAFLDSDDASLLPWNTTKTDLLPEMPAYIILKEMLIEATRPVIDFLNNLDAENDLEEDDRELSLTVDETSPRPLDKLPMNPHFIYRVPKKKGPPMSTISFRKPRDIAMNLKGETNSSSLKELGSFCFDFVYEEFIDEEAE